MTTEEILLSDEFMDKFVAKFIEKAFPTKIAALTIDNPIAIDWIDEASRALKANEDVITCTATALYVPNTSFAEREKYACEVCGNVPDETGELRHGRGCFVVSEDGGGEEYIEMEET